MKIIFFLQFFLLVIFNEIFSQSYNLSEIGRWAGGYCYAVATDSNYVYRGNGGYFEVIDLQNPKFPQRIGQVQTPGMVRSIAVNGSYAYVADWHKGLIVIDISNPYDPKEVGTYDTKVGSNDLWGKAIDVTISGNFVYLADDGGGVHSGIYIIDVSNPSNPQEVGVYVTAGYCFGVVIRGSYLYAASGLSGLVVLDVSNPSIPQEIGSFSADGLNAYDVEIESNFAYLASYETGLRVIDISNPSNPQEVGFFDTPHQSDVIAINGNYAYITDRQISDFQESGIHIVDISSPSNPQEVSYHKTSRISGGITVRDTLAYIANLGGGLRVLNVSSPDNPWETSFYETPDITDGLAINGNYAYLANGYSGLRVIDISNISNPKEMGFCDTPGSAIDVAFYGNYVYVADYYGLDVIPTGFRIIDVSNPNNPWEIGYYNLNGTVFDIEIVDNYLYVSCKGLHIFDISNPTNPQELSYYEEQNGYLTVSGNYAYIATSKRNGGSLYILDISNPTSPHELGHIDTPGWGRNVTVVGKYAYVANWSSGLRVIDISNPNIPQEIGSWNPYYDLVWAEDVAISGNYAYLACNRHGVYMLDIHDPTNPQKVGFYDLPIEARSIVIDEGNIIVGAGIWGMMVLHNDSLTGPVPAPIADFSSNPTSGDLDLSVNFTDISTGDVTTWSWDFGDGGTSTEQNPSHTYTAPGTYTVSLNVTGVGGSDTETKSDYITVTTPSDIFDLVTVSKAIIYPNPANIICTIRIPDNITSTVDIKIFNISGKVLILKNDIIEKMYNMNISELKAGLYYISIISDNNTLTEKMTIIE